MSTTQRSEADRVRIFDTTLRDGEQSPGISLNRQEKLEIAHQLARLGVDIIEAGFPITSPGDFESVQAIAREVQGPVICGLARTSKQDIDAAWNAVRDSERPRIHTFIATSDIHIERKLQTTREDVKGQVRAAVAHARSYTDDVEFSPEDGSRSDVEYMAEVIQIAIDEGATTINVPDTVGYTMPREYAAMFVTSWSRSTATTIWVWRSPTRWPAWKRAAARSSARSTASASGPATHRWRRS
jgi:2-isopropylmalate synthase